MRNHEHENINHDLSKFIIVVLFLSVFLIFQNKSGVTTTNLENYSLKLTQRTNKNKELGLKTIIYNRVPKCGSTTMTQTLELLKNKNSFEIKNYVVPREKHYFRNGTSDYNNFLDAIYSDSNLLYIRHFYHQSEIGFKYINFIRHPVEHFISWFYWERKINSGKWKHVVENGTENLSIDECINSGVFETCLHPGRYTEYLSYLCGQDWFCLDKFGDVDKTTGKFRNEKSDELKLKALEKAKSNIESDYLVVGVLELIEESLEVFDETVAWFSGIKKAYHVIENSRGKKVMVSDPISCKKTSFWSELTVFSKI